MIDSSIRYYVISIRLDIWRKK